MSRFRTARVNITIRGKLARGELYQLVEDLELKSSPIGFPDSETEKHLAVDPKILELQVILLLYCGENFVAVMIQYSEVLFMPAAFTRMKRVLLT